MSYELLPLNALRAFEAAARHMSFKRAADELNVTAAAVSHHVKTLEELCDVQLFYRLTRALQLTPEGERALPAMTEGFAKLKEGSEVLQRLTDDTCLTISASPSFCSLWLVPRLDSFQAAYPEVELRLDGTDRLMDVARGEADVAIRYGPGGYKGVEVDLLFGQLNTPVCSPALLSGENALRHPKDLCRHTLLHIDWKHADASWRMWLRAAGVSSVDPNGGPRFSQETMALEAALAGQGVALLGDRLIVNHLAEGRLVCPFGADVQTPLDFAYHLLTPRRSVLPTKIVAFREWLIAEAQLPGPAKGDH